jgi:hypothetical protein
MVDGLDICETSVTIPLNPVEPWTGTIFGSDPNTTFEQTAHVALTSLCEGRIAATAMMAIALFLIWNQENPMWKQHLAAMSEFKGPHFIGGMALMAKYVQYLFNLQHNTTRTIMQQRMHLTAYNEHNTFISCELEQLKLENALLCSGTLPPSD